MKLKGKVAFVTGGSSGIGLAICKRFIQEGAKVAFLSRSPKKLKKAKELLGENAFPFVCNVTDVESLTPIYEQAEQLLGKIDILVANAGIYKRMHIEKVSEQDFDEMMGINFKGVYFTVQKALKHLQDGASVQLIASIAGLRGVEEGSLYGSSKAAVQFLAKAFSADLLARSIRVNSISPGYILTPMVDTFTHQDPDLIEQLEARIPTKRVANANEVASLSLYLAEDDSKYIVGQNITIDGGLSAIAPPRNPAPLSPAQN